MKSLTASIFALFAAIFLGAGYLTTAVVMTGCSTTNSTNTAGNVDKAAATVQLVTHIAVFSVLQEHPDYASAFKAASVSIRKFALGADLSPESLETLIQTIGGGKYVALGLATGFAAYQIWYADSPGIIQNEDARKVVTALCNGIDQATAGQQPKSKLVRQATKPGN